MEKTELSPQEFKEILKTVNRFWNGESGLGLNQIKLHSDLSEISLIFVRDDGWSIACSDRHEGSCYGLWPQEWEVIYQKSVTKSEEI